jgi:hypothetical protein
MDRMIGAGRDSSASTASLFENPGDILMPPVARHFDEATVVETIPFRVHALIEQKVHHFKMAGAHCEVYGMCVEILCSAQSRSRLSSLRSVFALPASAAVIADQTSCPLSDSSSGSLSISGLRLANPSPGGWKAFSATSLFPCVECLLKQCL